MRQPQGQGWMRLADVCSLLDVNRRTVARRVKRGDIEAKDIGGTRFYRPVFTGDSTESIKDSRDRGQRPPLSPNAPNAAPDSHQNGANVSGNLVPAREVLALVERYETRIDALMTAERNARAEVTELATEVVELRRSVDAERHRAQLSQLEAQHAAQQAGEALNRERSRVAELQWEAETLRARLALPWWAWLRRRQASVPELTSA